MANTHASSSLPLLIQGGMGVAISNWKLANAVARKRQLGVVSGTAIDRVFACRLQEGDPDGSQRRAAAAFPDAALAQRVLKKWYRPEGLPTPGAYRAVPMHGPNARVALLELTVLAAFCEVWLAKEGHDGPVGINLLEKIQAPTLPILYGALLAHVDYVLMGAGIPREIPGHLDALCQHQATALKLHLDDGDIELLPFDPTFIKSPARPLPRPRFLAIISSHVLAMSLARVPGIDGFIVEGHQAGGHNAAPRGWKTTSGTEPAYGPKDDANLEKIKSLGLPFWLAGGYDDGDAIPRARALGAVGVQIGTLFAFCAESGMESVLRKRVLASALAGTLTTKTEGRGSPTGYPFKTLDLPGTEGGRDPAIRTRQTCTHGYLRTAFRKEDGSLGWHCAAEPMDQYAKKGGDPADCEGRRCLCNGLLATAGHAFAQRDGTLELPLLTAGILRDLPRFLNGADDYTASDVIQQLLSGRIK